jgi:hypothetical protein
MGKKDVHAIQGPAGGDGLQNEGAPRSRRHRALVEAPGSVGEPDTGDNVADADDPPEVAVGGNLPTGCHDVTALMEVAPPMWRRVLDAAGEPTHLRDEELTHDGLWQSITNHLPGRELLDALDVIFELGTDAGRDLLQQAADDQQVNMGASEDEPARELAARVWVESRTSTKFAEVLLRARVGAHQATHARAYREFVGKSSRAAGKLDRERLLAHVVNWCDENRKGGPVEVYAYERGAEWRFEILRGDPLKRVVELRNGRPSLLDFRPAAADHVRYDTETGRLGVATRSPRLLQMYREVLGLMLAADATFFSGENICTLRPLQRRGRELFEPYPYPGVLHVDVVELRWRRGDRDQFWVRGRDCFQVLGDLGARMNEGELIEAKLVIAFAGGGRLGHVSLKVPNRIDIKAGPNEGLVERMLDALGIRGAFGQDVELRDLWSLHPWRMPEDAWRQHVGPDFDRFVQTKTLRATHLQTTTHPDHPGAIGALTVEAINTATFVGVGEDPAIGLRTLTSSDLHGYELDTGAVARDAAASLELLGARAEISSGLWALGHRSLSPTITIAVFLALRQPTHGAGAVIHEAAKTARTVLLVPSGCSCTLDVAQIECRLPGGPFDSLVGDIVERLQLQEDVLPPLWLREDLIIERKSGRSWYRTVELTEKLRPDSHPFIFAVEVASARGRLVRKESLNGVLSSNRSDKDAAKKAKLAFIGAVTASFEAQKLEFPDAAKEIFVSRAGGYALNATARVLP